MKVWYWPGPDKIVIGGPYGSFWIAIINEKFGFLKLKHAPRSWINLGEL